MWDLVSAAKGSPFGDGSFALYDRTAQVVRLTVDGEGNVGVGTSRPETKLDVEGDVQARAFHTGDIVFQKNARKLWRMFEDDAGLYVENLTNGKLYSVPLEQTGPTREPNAAHHLQNALEELRAENQALKQRLRTVEVTVEAMTNRL